MKLSTETMQVLKNFASINPNLVVDAGNQLKTISEQKSIIGRVEVAEQFEIPFGIYDLPEFLRVMELADDPDLSFSSNSVQITGNGGLVKINYFFADRDVLTTINKDIKMPDAEVVFDLDTNTLNNIRRAASALGHSMLEVSTDNSDVDSSKQLVKLSVLDPDNPTSNSYAIDVPGSIKDLDDFKFYINIANFKVIPGTYRVEISSKLISQLTSVNATVPIKYWIALEKNSKVTKR